MIFSLLIFLLSSFSVISFLIPYPGIMVRYNMNIRNGLNSAITNNLIIKPDEKSVGLTLCNILEEQYKKAINAKGHFVFCISGGSMLQMLVSKLPLI